MAERGAVTGADEFALMNSVRQNPMNLIAFLRVNLQLIHTPDCGIEVQPFCHVFIRKFVVVCNCQG